MSNQTAARCRDSGPRGRTDLALSPARAMGSPRVGGIGRAVLAAIAFFGATSVAQAGPKVASLFCSTDFTVQSDIKKKLEDTKLFDKVDSVDVGASAPSLMTLQAYDAVLVWADTSRGCSDPTGLGNVLSQYADAGGGVVQMLPYYVNYTFNNVSGTFYTKYALVNQGSMTSARGLTLGTKMETTHPTLNSVNNVSNAGTYCYHRIKFTTGEIKNTGRVIATWSDGNPMVVVGNPNGKNRVDLNMYPASSDTGSGCLDPKSDAYRLVANSLVWVANPLRANPSMVDFGPVPAGTLSLPQVVEVTNTGTNNISLASGAVNPSTEFAVKLLDGASFPLNVTPGGKFRLEVTVRPTAPGSRQASYDMLPSVMGDTGLSIPLIAQGLGPQFKVDPGNLIFGGMPVGGMPRIITVTVTNTGGGLLVLRGAPTISDTTNFSISSPPMTPISLSAGASVSFDVKFSPTREARFTGYLYIPYNDGSDRTAQVPFDGSFGKPKIVVPGSIVLTPVRVNQRGPEQTITVRNDGMADLSISSVSFTGPNASDFLSLTVPMMGAPLVVPPNGGTQDIKLQCNPTMNGLRQATLNIVSDDPMTGTATIAFQCNGVVANFDIQPAKIDFTTPQQTGQCAAAQNVTITNTGTDGLRVLSIGFSGTNAASFKQPFTGGKIVNGGGGKLVIPVQFCPVDIGAQTADLVVATDLTMGHTAKVPLTGTGTGPKVVVTPGSLDFGPVYIKTVSAVKTIEIKNDGDQPLVFGKATITPAMGLFAVKGLPADGTKLNKADPPIKLEVTVNPMMSMQQSGEISIPVNDLVKMGTLRIPLSVTGTQADISAQPMGLSFPVTIIGTRSMDQNITVTNTGMAPLMGIAITVAGANSGDFVATTGMIPMSVAAGQSFQIPVAFRPTGNGVRNGIVVINASGLMAPVQVKVDGTGKLLTVACNPDEKNFGSVSLGNSNTQKFVCRNSDSNDIDYIASFGDFIEDWTVEAAEGKIPAAQSGDDGLVTLQVTFKPTATGPRTTTMTLKTKDGITIGSISLDGTGTPMKVEKPPVDQGCAYGGRPGSPSTALLLIAAMGLLGLVRRRRLGSP